ncbi:MAG: hypothetical protein ABIS51_02865 [Sphingomonas sp.]
MIETAPIGAELRADIQFAEFYRTRLRRTVGERVESSVLMAAHTAWAQRGYGSTIGFKQLRRFMRERGHRHFYSNRAWYGDVVILAEDEVVIGEADQHRYELSYAVDLIARLDVIASDIAALRARLAEAVR